MEVFLEHDAKKYESKIVNYDKYLTDFFRKLQEADKKYPDAVNNEEYNSYVIYNKWPIRKLEYSYVIGEVEKVVFPGAKLLEAGCGVSPLPFLWSKLGADVVAVDISKKSVSMMERFSRDDYFEISKNIKCEYADIVNIPFVDNTFDIITSVSVIEHLPYPQYLMAFNEIYRVLKPGGTFICTCDLKAEKKSKFSSIGAFSKDDIKFILDYYKEELAESANYDLFYKVTEENIELFWKNFNYEGSGYTKNREYTAVGFSYTKSSDRINNNLFTIDNLLERAKEFQEQYSQLEKSNFEKEEQIQILSKAANERLESILKYSNNSIG